MSGAPVTPEPPYTFKPRVKVEPSIPMSATCLVIPLTMKIGPNAGTTRVYCTCGWDQTYKRRKKAIKRAIEHVEGSTR